MNATELEPAQLGKKRVNFLRNLIQTAELQVNARKRLTYRGRGNKQRASVEGFLNELRLAGIPRPRPRVIWEAYKAINGFAVASFVGDKIDDQRDDLAFAQFNTMLKTWYTSVEINGQPLTVREYEYLGDAMENPMQVLAEAQTPEDFEREADKLTSKRLELEAQESGLTDHIAYISVLEYAAQRYIKPEMRLETGCYSLDTRQYLPEPSATDEEGHGDDEQE